MTVKFVEVTAATAIETADHHDVSQTDAGARTAPDDLPASRRYRPGQLLAALFLSTAISTAGVAMSGLPLLVPSTRRTSEESADGSTLDVELDSELVSSVAAVFEAGAEEFFIDGMRSRFSSALLALVARHGRQAFRAMERYIFSGEANPDVVSEALRLIGDINHPDTLPRRWSILQHSLKDPSPRVRDGAILGFAALDDRKAQSILIEAGQRERIAELRRLIDQVVQQLARNG